MSEKQSYLLVFIAGCLWGVQGLFMKLLSAAGSTSLYTSFGRMLFGFLIVLVITVVKGGLKTLKVGRKTMISCILLGVISQAIYNYAYSSAVNTVGMATACVLAYTAPIFTSAVSKVLFKESFTLRKLSCLALNIVGCFLVVTGGRFDSMSLNVAGILFGIVAGITYGMAPIFGRMATDEKSSDPFAVATYNFLFGALVLAVFQPWKTVENPLSMSLIKPLLMLAFFSTVLTYVLYYTGLKNIKESSKVPVVASIEIVVATFFGVLVFNEDLVFGSIIGTAIVLASIIIMNINPGKNPGKSGEQG